MRKKRKHPLLNGNKKSRLKILITAGPTVEYLDPIRFISNRSTGVLGYEIARRAQEKGMAVVLITGPVALPAPHGVKTVKVESAREMFAETKRYAEKADCLIMTAAVSDFRPKVFSQHKIKKKNTEEKKLMLLRNPDILKWLSGKKELKKIGFAVETQKAVARGVEKLREKKLDLLVLNEKNTKNDPFGPGKKKFLLLFKDGRRREIKKADKQKAAKIILEEAVRLTT